MCPYLCYLSTHTCSSICLSLCPLSSNTWPFICPASDLDLPIHVGLSACHSALYLPIPLNTPICPSALYLRIPSLCPITPTLSICLSFCLSLLRGVEPSGLSLCLLCSMSFYFLSPCSLSAHTIRFILPDSESLCPPPNILIISFYFPVSLLSVSPYTCKLIGLSPCFVVYLPVPVDVCQPCLHALYLPIPVGTSACLNALNLPIPTGLSSCLYALNLPIPVDLSACIYALYCLYL
jgi:hypothetical protein